MLSFFVGIVAVPYYLYKHLRFLIVAIEQSEF
jgi:hypothetical protein